MLVDDLQFSVGFEDEDLGGASVLKAFLHRFACACGYACGMELEGVARDGDAFIHKLHIHEAHLDPNRGLGFEVLTAAARDGEPPGFGAHGRGTEDGRIRSVEFFQLFRRLGREDVPEAGDFGANFFGSDLAHAQNLLHYGNGYKRREQPVTLLMAW